MGNYGQSKKGKLRRLSKANKRFDKWIETCLRVNKKLEDTKENKN